jgi:hypothetical protein
VVKATNILTLLALGILPLALAVGCQPKQSKEEIIAEFQAHQAEQDRVAKLEAELAEMKDQQAADSAAAQQAKDEAQEALQKQIDAAKQRAAKAEKEAKEAKEAAAQPQSGRRGGRGDAAGDGQQVARSSVLNVPQGTELVVSPSGKISTETHQTGASWDGTLAQDVAANGETIWRAGTRVAGVVSQSTPTGRLATGEGALAIKLTEVGGAGIDGGIYVVTVSQGKRTAQVIGTTTALGALAGILSNKSHKSDHALGGAAIGAAVGTALAAGTANTAIEIPASTPVKFQLPSAERVVVRNR